MTDIKLYQIPRSVLAKEPKPIVEIDFIEELQAEGYAASALESPQTLSLIGSVADMVAERLGHAARTNYGVLSVFDHAQMAAYQTLLEDYRMNPEPAPEAPVSASAESAAKDGKKKKKKKKKK